MNKGTKRTGVSPYAARYAPQRARALQRLFLDALRALGRASVPQARHTRGKPRDGYGYQKRGEGGGRPRWLTLGTIQEI